MLIEPVRGSIPGNFTTGFVDFNLTVMIRCFGCPASGRGRYADGIKGLREVSDEHRMDRR